MKKYALIGAVMTFSMVLTLTLAASSFAKNDSSNLQGRGFNKLTTEEMELAKQNHEDIQNAILNNDFATWSSLVVNSPRSEEMLEKINVTNFPKFVEAHKIMEESRVKMDEARKIMEELGLEPGPKGLGQGIGMKKGFGKMGMGQHGNFKNPLELNETDK